ncbi:MAG: hypothetical protein JWP29_5106, partial [Rhodoferax sp.]|nr:hypothetical protein [Rhodoferax sp.]
MIGKAGGYGPRPKKARYNPICDDS